MELIEAKSEFIQAWGTLGTSWGINRTMAQIHALLLISSEPQSAEDIMQDLSISRGNANMNIRALIDWGLVEKKLKLGERKEFFSAEKDLWKVSTRVLTERRKRELEPLRSSISALKEIDKKDSKTEEGKEFLKTINDIESFSNTADKMLQKMILAEQVWFFDTFTKLMK